MSRVAGIFEGPVDIPGPLSPSVRIDRLVAVSGQCGYLPGRRLVEGIEEQTRVALQNLQRALDAFGCALDDVLAVTVYLVDRQDLAPMNRVYQEFFDETPQPARTTVYAGLGVGVLVEIDCLAVVPVAS
ncbi:RidA family protein [Aeromicrobium phragmitis]|uniref:RidA family protein n=1 Tax=Aeromicrobium phragmitis TaxID=2478914 RepID=A0A3L8PLY4_9ACTN|nr:RidA family protein [Aeromicrobium phragmitis]RLV56361.1 RidA family protein [Aeromicrobium phragmitis]